MNCASSSVSTQRKESWSLLDYSVHAWHTVVLPTASTYNAALVPRCRVVCEGTITVLRAQDICVPPLNDCEISCTVKLDVDMLVSPQLTPAVLSVCCTFIISLLLDVRKLSFNSVKDSTSPAPVGECSTEGWGREALKFTSKKNLDIDIQLWAYRLVLFGGPNFSVHIYVCIHSTHSVNT